MASTVPLPWKTNILGILGDCRILFASLLCPALAYYATSEQFEEPPAGVVESCIGGYCLCCGWMLRERMRKKYGLDGSAAGDFLAHLCCHCVALARIWREAETQAEAKAQEHSYSGQIHQTQTVPPYQQPSISLPSHAIIYPSGGQQMYMQPSLPAGVQPMTYVDRYGAQQVYVRPGQVMMPQFATVHPQQQPMFNMGDTVDTNLSEFDSKNEPMVGREDTSSLRRTNSMDPPPSNTDPDPWDMIPSREEMRRQQGERQQEQPREDVRSPVTPKPAPMTQPPQSAGVSYEDYIVGRVPDVMMPAQQQYQQQTSDGPAHRVESDESSESRRAQLNQRLAGLRPSNLKHPNDCRHGRDESEGSTSRVAHDTCELSDPADQVILSGTHFIRMLSIPQEESEDIQPRTSQDDPPQPSFDHIGSSALSKPDDGSFMTRGATAGSEIRQGRHSSLLKLPTSHHHM